MNLRLATPADVPAVYGVMHAAYEALSDKSLYITDEMDYIAAQFSGGSFILLAQENGKAVGFFLVCVPGQAENNLGRCLDYSPRQLSQVAMMDSAAVLPEYQGRGIMGTMFRRAVELARYPILLGTVSPHNAPSLKNFQRCGFSVLKTIRKPGGYERLLMGRFQEIPAARG